MIVAKFKQRRLDDEAVDPLDKPAPIGAAPKLPVGDNRKPDLLLQTDHVADALVLDPRKTRVVDAPGEVVLECLPQQSGTQQATDMIGTERRAGLRVGEHQASLLGTLTLGSGFRTVGIFL